MGDIHPEDPDQPKNHVKGSNQLNYDKYSRHFHLMVLLVVFLLFFKIVLKIHPNVNVFKKLMIVNTLYK